MPAYDAQLFAPPAPIAHVTLRRAETGDKVANVPMLLDSGADVTLIPQPAASHLGAAINANQTYELIGFDGNKTIAQAVQLDLLFLGRCFSGRFLLIDQEWGILGRDIIEPPHAGFGRAAVALERVMTRVSPQPYGVIGHRDGPTNPPRPPQIRFDASGRRSPSGHPCRNAQPHRTGEAVDDHVDHAEVRSRAEAG